GVEAQPRKPQVLAQHLDAQVARYATAGLGHVDVGDVAGHAAQQEQGDDRHRQDEAEFAVAIDEGLVDHGLHQLGERCGRGGLEQHADARNDQQRTVRAGETEQPPIDLPRGGGFTHGTAPLPSPVGAVALMTRLNPSWPSASYTVTTAWYGVRASARSITGRSRSLPATSAMVAFSAPMSVRRTSRSSTK